MKNNLYKSSITGGFQFLLNSMFIIVAIPSFIKELGTEAYGVFSLLLLLGNLNVFMNAGLNTSLTKFLSEQGKSLESNYDIIISFIILLFLSIPILIIGFFFKKVILLKILGISQNLLTNDVLICYQLLLLASFFNIIGQISVAILDSLQKMYLSNIFQMIYNFFYWGFILVTLRFNPSLAYIGLSILLATILWFTLITVTALKSWGRLYFNGFGSTIKILKKQLSYSSKIYLSGTINFFYEPMSKILVSNFIGITEVGILDIALRIRIQIWSLISKIIYPIYPKIAELNNYSKIRFLIHDLEQKIAFIVLPFVVVIIFTSESLIFLWIGSNSEIIALSSNVLLLSSYLSMLVLPNYLFLIAKGHASKTILMQTLNVLVNLFFFFLLSKSLGYYSILISNFFAIISSFIVCLYYQRKYFNSLIFNDIRQLIYFVFIGITLFINGYFFSSLSITPWIKISIILIVIPIIGIWLFRRLSIFSIEDIERYFKELVVLKFLARKLLIK